MPGAGVVHHIIRVTLTVRQSPPVFPNKHTIQEPGGFEIALTGIAEDELSRLSVGVGELEQMPELPDGERSPYRDMTFILYGNQIGIVEGAIARATKLREPNNPNRSPQGNALAAICAEYLGRVA
jgi:hypothetical protein